MVLDACDKWLQQAEALVIEADAKIEGIMHQDTGNLLAEEWVTFVHKYSMQIKDIEQVGQSICVDIGACQVSSYVSVAAGRSVAPFYVTSVNWRNSAALQCCCCILTQALCFSSKPIVC